MKVLVYLIITALAAVISCATRTADTQNKSIENRLRILEDREEIRQLLIEYGRTLDARDFDGFSDLFVQDALYTSGGGNPVRGAGNIAKLLQDVFDENPTGVKSPNFHLFANETLRVNGDEATALSKGIFVVPGEDNQPEAVMLATYTDEIVRKNDRWKFKQRLVQGDIP